MCRPKHVEWTCREINFTAHCRICWLFHRTRYRIKKSTVLRLELQIKCVRKVLTQVHTVNSDSRTSNCQCSLFSKKNPIIRIFCISGWLAITINPDMWSANVFASCSTYLRVYFGRTLLFAPERYDRWQNPWTRHIMSQIHTSSQAQTSQPVSKSTQTKEGVNLIPWHSPYNWGKCAVKPQWG